MPVSPPSLQEATSASTSTWQSDLEELFMHAKDRFPDVVWDLIGEDDSNGIDSDQVWGHKAIVYARAPPTFQARYFSFRPAPVSSPLPYSSSPNAALHAQSAFSLATNPELPSLDRPRPSSPFRVSSPSPSTGPGGILRLTTAINPTLFSNELEYLYTGKGFGEAFEFLFDTNESREEGDAEENRIDKLRKDLVFMWRSRLYSDVRVSLTGNFSSTHSDGPTTAVFSSHRFILVSRSSYFYNLLIGWGSPPVSKTNEPLTLKLPSPPFTPASLHFTLGYIYTGTLIFSHRTYDLETAFHIMRSATYLSLKTLYDEAQARIVQEMMHGLFHAFLEFNEYERITAGKWGTGGCRCRQCARRAPRILEFALQDDVKNSYLEAGARRALVGMFGEGWCNADFATLPQKIRESLLKGLAKRTTPLNVFALLFAAHHALGKLSAVIEPWAEVVKEMVLSARKVMDDVMCSKADECFEQEDWIELMNADGIRFEDDEKVQWTMDAVMRGIAEKNVAVVYQTLVSSILLRVRTTEKDVTILSNTSHVRAKVEETRMYLLRWIRKRWFGIRQAHGFDSIAGWSLSEISAEIEVPVEDLRSTEANGAPNGSGGARPSHHDNESDSISLRASVLSRNMDRPTRTVSPSSASMSTVSRTTSISSSVARKPPSGPRPDSKLSPSSMSIHSRTTLDTRSTTGSTKIVLSRPAATQATARAPRPKSSASSVVSHASTIRKSGAAGPSASTTLRPPSSAGKARPPSSAGKARTPPRPASGASDMSASFKTASAGSAMYLHPGPSRSRRASVASTASNVSVSTTHSKATPAVKTPKRPPPPMPNAKAVTSTRSPSVASVRSTISTAASSYAKTAVAKKVAEQTKRTVSTSSANGTPVTTPIRSQTAKGQDNTRSGQLDVGPSVADRLSTREGPLKRKGSADTITKKRGIINNNTTTTISTKRSSSPLGSEEKRTSQTSTGGVQLVTPPRGATLEMGIACIVSSKRRKFKAFARYIGEVEGEDGPWVGLEVPIGESGWTTGDDEQIEGPLWNDGTWGGIRYFEIGCWGSEWDFGDERSSRRRRVDIGTKEHGGVKREGDTLRAERAKRMRSVSPARSDVSNSETRGLFVRPQQVLYVMDAML